MIKTIAITTAKQGLNTITGSVKQVVNTCDLDEGLCTIYMPHHLADSPTIDTSIKD